MNAKEAIMSRSLATEPEMQRRLLAGNDRQRTANNTTFTVTSIASDGLETVLPARLLDAPVVRLLGYARSALNDDVAAATVYLARAIAMLESMSVAGSPRAEPVPAAHNRGGLARWQINRITTYIDANIGSAIRATDLAALVRLSASHFFHAFKDTFAETPLAYVARRRMALAQQLMLTTDEPLAQIALACGLCDQSHFTRVFRRVVGTSPYTWRREHAHGPNPADAVTVCEGSDLVPGVTRH
jgi:AraC-like DNA-binding protein